MMIKIGFEKKFEWKFHYQKIENLVKVAHPEITFEIYYKLYSEGNLRKETCENLRSNLMVSEVLNLRELRPKSSYSEGVPVVARI